MTPTPEERKRRRVVWTGYWLTLPDGKRIFCRNKDIFPGSDIGHVGRLVMYAWRPDDNRIFILGEGKE